MVQIKLPDGSSQGLSRRGQSARGCRRHRQAPGGRGGRGGRARPDCRPRSSRSKMATPPRSRCGFSRPRTARHSTSCGTRRRTSWPGPSCGSFPACGSPSDRPPRPAFITTSRYPAEASPRMISPPSRPRWPGWSRTPSRSSGSALPVAEARQFVADLGQTFKVEHIDDELHKYGILSFYRQGEFVDLCRGPHIPARRQGRGVQAAVDRRGLLEGPDRSPDASARLRHGLLRQEGAGRPHRPGRRGQETRPSPARPRAQPLHDLAAGRTGAHPLDAQGGGRPRHPRELHQG